MPLHRHKRIVLAIAALAVLSVSAAGLVYWRELVEDWYLRKLESEDTAERLTAIEKLGELRSVRAVPAFLKLLDKFSWGDRARSTPPPIQTPSGLLSLRLDNEPPSELERTILTTCQAIGHPAAPVAFRMADSRNDALAQLAEETLTEMGPAKEVGEASKNPMLRMRYAQALARKGRPQEALEQFLWCFDHGNEHARRFRRFRVFFLSEITTLGSTYPPALDALRERRDLLESKLLTEAPKTNWLEDVSDFTLLNRVLRQSSRSLALLEKLKDSKDASEIRKLLLDGDVLDLLLQQRRYSEIVELVGNARTRLAQRIGISKKLMMARFPDGGEVDGTKFALEEGGRLYQAYLGAHKSDEAADIAKQLIDFWPYGKTYATLVRRAMLAGKPETAKDLLGKAEAALPKGDLEEPKDAYIRTTLQAPVTAPEE